MLNIDNEPIKVNHRDLIRSDLSAYRSECLICADGILLVGRNFDGSLSEYDICVLCGQRYVYKDIEIMREMEK